VEVDALFTGGSRCNSNLVSFCLFHFFICIEENRCLIAGISEHSSMRISGAASRLDENPASFPSPDAENTHSSREIRERSFDQSEAPRPISRSFPKVDIGQMRLKMSYRDIRFQLDVQNNGTRSTLKMKQFCSTSYMGLNEKQQFLPCDTDFIFRSSCY
jgi:hypothetical protein